MNLDLIYIIIGVIFGMFALARIEFAIWLILALSLIVGGLASYFLTGFGRVQWATAVLSFFLLLRAMFGVFANQRGNTRLSRIIVYVMLFAISTAITVAINVEYLLDAVISAKNTFQFLSVLLALGLVIRSERFSWQLMTAFLVVAAIQPAFAILQYFLERGELFIGDRISGTFGGVRGMPGGHAAMTMFMLVQIASILALVQQKRLRWTIAVPLIVWFIIPVMLTHFKAVILLLPPIFLILYGSQLLRRPLVAIGGLLIFAVLAGATLYYQYRTAGDYRDDRLAPTSFSEYIWSSFEYNISQDKVRGLNRMRAIQFWWEEHNATDGAISFFFGHGLGATRDFGISLGHLTKEPRYAGRGIGITTLPRLLWEVGVIGATLFVAIFVAALLAARRLRHHPALTSTHKAYMTSAMVASMVFLFTVPYDITLTASQSFSAFTMFILGYIAFWERRCQYGSITSAPPLRRPTSVYPSTNGNARLPIGAAVSRGSDVNR